MRLIEFHGYGIRGYQEQHVNFREEMTFLIGINGSGKTTVLNLIQGLLRPSYRTLDTIEFDEIQVVFYSGEDGNRISVTCMKSKEDLRLVLRSNDDILESMTFKRVGERYPDYEDDERGEIYMKLNEEFANQTLCRMVSSYNAPMFLTLDRLPQNIDRNILVHRMRARRPMIPRGSIDTCLMAIQEAIYNQYRLNASKQNNFVVNLRNKIVEKSLSFMADEIFNKQTSMDEIVAGFDTIDHRESEFMEVMDGLGIPGVDRIGAEFFSKLKEAAEIIKDPSKDKYTEQEKNTAIARWIFSQSQLKRVEEISKLGHDYQDKIAKLQEPMNRFKDCVNMFFSECGKTFILDQAGNMKVKSPKGTSKRIVNEVTELSSGEKQIVAMLGSLIFLRDDNDPEVYFIDEPEISLHLSWQDIFVDALLKACPNYQFVLATHSPNIIAKEERRSWCEDLSPKFLKDGTI